jgi:hypothetical protein
MSPASRCADWPDRLATLAVFFANGLGLGAWAARAPSPIGAALCSPREAPTSDQRRSDTVHSRAPWRAVDYGVTGSSGGSAPRP